MIPTSNSAPAAREKGSAPTFINGISSGPIQVNNAQGWSSSPGDSLDVKYTYLHWKWPSAAVSNGIEYWINRDDFPTDANYDSVAARIAIQDAFDAWTNIQGATINFDYKGYTSTTRNGTDGKNVVVWETGLPGTAIADLDGNSSGMMTDVDIAIGADDAWVKNDTTRLREVMIHEVGHLLGLGDLGGVADKTANRIMWLRAPSDFNFTEPDDDTADGIRRIYGKWSGQLDAEQGETVWPDTMRLSGDVTVPSGDTLKIKPNAVVIIDANSDDESGGSSSSKTELIEAWS